jgi:hypothetical protein
MSHVKVDRTYAVSALAGGLEGCKPSNNLFSADIGGKVFIWGDEAAPSPTTA